MILLDTNVLSALMQSPTDRQVVDWLDAQDAPQIWISSITVFEARYGLQLLPQGRRKTQLTQRFDELVRIDLAHRIAAFDTKAAQCAAELAAERKTRGRPVDMRDTFIAGIALAHRATLATRNVRHFEDLRIRVVDPWG